MCLDIKAGTILSHPGHNDLKNISPYFTSSVSLKIHSQATQILRANFHVDNGTGYDKEDVNYLTDQKIHRPYSYYKLLETMRIFTFVCLCCFGNNSLIRRNISELQKDFNRRKNSVALLFMS